MLSSSHPLPARERLAFPLDVPSLEEASRWVERLYPQLGLFKVGLELFCAEGPAAVHMVNRVGSTFLDLKLHDIPATMAKAVHRAADLGVRYLTLHASAGPAALAACAEAAHGTTVELLAVTVLTSMDPNELAATTSTTVTETVEQRVLALAKMATEAGISGFVSSPWEAAKLRALFPDATLVTPGIRLFQRDGEQNDDQKRVASPQEAVEAGADVLVVGRPIRLATKPEEVVTHIINTLERNP